MTAAATKVAAMTTAARLRRSCGGGELTARGWRPPIPRKRGVPALAVIPARAGSRGLPGKHLRLIGGEPMLLHTLRAALAARRVDRVVVTTNDPAVARLARRALVGVVERPAAL